MQIEIFIKNSEGVKIEMFKVSKKIAILSSLCLDGQQLSKDGKCETCPIGQFMLESTSLLKTCKICEKNSLCPGGKYLLPI